MAHVRKPTGQISYHLETKTYFSLFDNLDLLSSGCFSRNRAVLFKGEAAIIFKTPSTADVLFLKLVTVCCFYVSSLNSLPSPSAAVHIERSHVVQVSSLVLFFYSALRASVALRATCRAPARLWLAVIDFQNGEQQSRSGSDKKRRNRLQ